MDIDEIGFRLIIISIISLFILATFAVVNVYLIMLGFTGFYHWLWLFIIGGLFSMLEVGIALIIYTGE